MTYPVKTPFFYKLFFTKILWQGEGRNIYLTFDDGPDEDSTERLLAILAREKVSATFFCLGKQVEKHPYLFQRIKDAHHLIAHHSYSHLNGFNTSKKEYISDVMKGAKMLDTNFFRPPYGKITFAQYRALKKNNQKIVLWSVMPGDFDSNVETKLLLQRMKKYLQEGVIYVLHDQKMTIGKLEIVLPEFIHWARKVGYKFSTLEQFKVEN